MTIREQAIAEYSENTTKNQWYICNCPQKLSKLKGIVEPENGQRIQYKGNWVKILYEMRLGGGCIGLPKSLFRKATLEDIKNHKFKDEL